MRDNGGHRKSTLKQHFAIVGSWKTLESVTPVTPTERTEKVAKLMAVKTLGRPSVLKTLPPLNILLLRLLGSDNVVSSSSGATVVA